MKSFIIFLAAMFVTVAAFSQQAKDNHSDSSIKSYLTYNCSLHPQYVSSIPAKCPLCKMDMILSKKAQMKAAVMKLYTCSMHANVISTKADKCPVCEMDMVMFKPKVKATKD